MKRSRPVTIEERHVWAALFALAGLGLVVTAAVYEGAYDAVLVGIGILVGYRIAREL